MSQMPHVEDPKLRERDEKFAKHDRRLEHFFRRLLRTVAREQA